MNLKNETDFGLLGIIEFDVLFKILLAIALIIITLLVGRNFFSKTKFGKWSDKIIQNMSFTLVVLLSVVGFTTIWVWGASPGQYPIAVWAIFLASAIPILGIVMSVAKSKAENNLNEQNLKLAAQSLQLDCMPCLDLRWSTDHFEFENTNNHNAFGIRWFVTIGLEEPYKLEAYNQDKKQLKAPIKMAVKEKIYSVQLDLPTGYDKIILVAEYKDIFCNDYAQLFDIDPKENGFEVVEIGQPILNLKNK